MRPINMTPERDNNIIWLVRITRGAEVWRFSTKSIDFGDGEIYDGEALGINDHRFSLNEIGKRINIPSGGTIGEISTITFSFIRYGSNAFINDFFNEFYPATSGKILVAMDVEVGMIWDSSTDKDDITWLYKYNVEEYNYSDNLINLVCMEFSDFEYFNLPYYRVQTEYDDGISYYPDSPKDAHGKNIPLVYGRARQPDTTPYTMNFTPTIRVGDKKFLIASHECYNQYSPSTDNRMFEEIAEY